MDLWLFRHGVPVEPEHWGGDDRSRPLTAEGRAQVRAVAEELLRTGRVDAALELWTSPYARCRETAEIWGECLGVPPSIVPGLGSGAHLMVELPRRFGASGAGAGGAPGDGAPPRLLCVGHSPDLGLLIGALIGDRSGRHALGRAGCARLAGTFEPGGMRLGWALSAGELVRG